MNHHRFARRIMSSFSRLSTRLSCAAIRWWLWNTITNHAPCGFHHRPRSGAHPAANSWLAGPSGVDGTSNSITGQWLRKKRQFPSRGQRRPITLEIEFRQNDSRPARCGAGRTCNDSQPRSQKQPQELDRDFPVESARGGHWGERLWKRALIRECLWPAIQAAVGKDRREKPRIPNCGLRA